LEYGARTIRRKITDKLPEFLTQFPPVIKHEYPAKSKAEVRIYLNMWEKPLFNYHKKENWAVAVFRDQDLLGPFLISSYQLFPPAFVSSPFLKIFSV
jgi:hypothetical protein